jgi:hypothetical protein
MELRSPAHRVLLAPQDCGRYRTRRTSGNMHLHSLAGTTSAIGSYWFLGLTILKWKICLSQDVQKTGIHESVYKTRFSTLPQPLSW